jgi:lipopolysaccharide transport protein LptA
LVDVHKIDEFFNGKRPFSDRLKHKIGVRERTLRIAKLIMPSVAAVIICFIIIFPSLKNETVRIKNDVTFPKEGELEKLHIENTTFSITDRENKISIFTADSLDEMPENSEVVKIMNPKGKLAIGKQDEIVDMVAKFGFYNQSKSHIKIQDDVKVVYTDGSTVLTNSAEYDFNQSLGYGNEDIHAFGSWGKLWAQGFEYFQKDELLVLNGKSKVLNEDGEITSCKQMRFYKNENRLEAEGNVIIKTSESILYADVVKADLVEKSGISIKKIVAFGNIKVVTKDGIARGQYAVYDPEKSEIQLEQNVSIEKDGNIIYGQKAIANIKTSVSKILTGPGSKNRVSGVIRGNTLKRNKHEKKQ